MKRENGGDLNPSQGRHQEKSDFGGPLGAFALILALPGAVLFLNLKIVQKDASLFTIPPLPNMRKFLTDDAWVMVGLWFLGHILFAALPLGSLVHGRPLRSGKSLSYRCNGFLALVLCVAGFMLLERGGFGVAELVEKKWLELATVSGLFSAGLSLLLYMKSFEASHMDLATQGNTGNVVYDFFMGRELNPRLGPIDLKFVSELRPGLIGWVILDLSVLVADYNRQLTLNWSLVFVVAAQTLYVADSLWFEASILSTMDIIHEGFGFMLAFGDLCWVPFTYSLQVRWIASRGLHLPPYYVVGLALLNAVGYSIFRASNLQKDRYRNNPDHPSVKGLDSIPTGVKDRRLLCGGWWGWVRHPNYLGDIIMAWSWCLACGLGGVVPYFYAVYLSGLLMSRELRDEQMNLRKYGSAWTEYTRRVPFRIFPGLW